MPWLILGLIASLLGRRWEVRRLGDDRHFGDIEELLVEFSLANTSSSLLVDRLNKYGDFVDGELKK